MKAKKRIRDGFTLLALLALCVLSFRQAVQASDVEAQTEVRLFVEEDEKMPASSGSDNEDKAAKTDNTGVQTGDSEDILLWGLAGGAALSVCIAGIVYFKKYNRLK